RQSAQAHASDVKKPSTSLGKRIKTALFKNA
ncbi:MAG: hypothetical protein ACI955_003203, partial [Zhongshania sp.]